MNYLINDDGTTYNWALKSIESALNKRNNNNCKSKVSLILNGLGWKQEHNFTVKLMWYNGQRVILKDQTASAQKDNLDYKGCKRNYGKY
jgi:hypothetical protein